MSEERRSRARRGLDEAAGFLDAYRREAGVEPAPDLSEAARGAAEASLRAALEAARERIETLSREGANSRAEAAAARAEAERLRRELEKRPEPGAPEAARAEAEEQARKARQDLEARCASLEERLTLMGAERVRVESLRRKAEQGAAESEAARRAIEDALRRELRGAHAALDRAAAEAGAREAKARADIDPLRTRLENTLLRLEQLERERSGEQAKVRAQVAAAALEARHAEEETGRAQAVSASLRRELEKLKVLADEREATLRGKLEALERALASARAEGALPLIEETPLLAEPELPELPDFVAPALEPVLDPGWGRLLKLVRPSVEAAYSHLRRLSAAPLKPGAKSLVRLAAASIGQAADSLSSIELALSEGPAPVEPLDAMALVEQCLAAWEPALRKRGVSLLRDIKPGLPRAAVEKAPLRVLLFHVLRNELEALPKGAKLTVKALKSPDGALRLEFSDDGPGFPAAWLERRFEPFAAPRKGRAGLGLSILRRTLRRWGGDAEASNGPGNKGARLTLTFPPPLPQGPAMI